MKFDVEKLREDCDRAQRRFDEATGILKAARQKVKDAELDWQARNVTFNEVRAKLLIALEKGE